MPGGRVRLTPLSSLEGRDRLCWGGPLVPKVHPDPVGGCHCVPGAGLCTLRSVWDLGAAGREGGRTLSMVGRGCDVSGSSAGHCLYRNQPMKSGGDCRNPDSSVLQSCASAPSPRRATLDPGRECRTEVSGSRAWSWPGKASFTALAPPQGPGSPVLG